MTEADQETLRNILGIDDDVPDFETELTSVDGTIKVDAGREPGTAIVSYLSIDDTSQGEYFGNNDGAGVYTECRSRERFDGLLQKAITDGLLAFSVERYKYGNVHYSVAGTGQYPDRQWDVGLSGVYVPGSDDQDAHKQAMSKAEDAAGPGYSGPSEGLGEYIKKRMGLLSEVRDEFVRRANAVLDNYSMWCNGEVYGAVVETVAWDGVDMEFIQKRDDIWGMVGQEWAAELLIDIAGPHKKVPDATHLAFDEKRYREYLNAYIVIWHKGANLKEGVLEAIMVAISPNTDMVVLPDDNSGSQEVLFTSKGEAFKVTVSRTRRKNVEVETIDMAEYEAERAKQSVATDAPSFP